MEGAKGQVGEAHLGSVRRWWADLSSPLRDKSRSFPKAEGFNGNNILEKGRLAYGEREAEYETEGGDAVPQIRDASTEDRARAEERSSQGEAIQESQRVIIKCLEGLALALGETLSYLLDS